MTTLIVHQEDPMNAEPHIEALGKQMITPANLIFQRNHGAIRHLPRDHRVALTWSEDAKGKAKATNLSFCVTDLEKYEQADITAVLQCAGNRRDEMSDRGRKTEGLGWGSAVAANIRWTGVGLALLLRDAGVPADAIDQPEFQDVHVEFASDDTQQDDEYYGSSVTLADALSDKHPVILAIRMNGLDRIPDEHGGPIRVVVPGQIGARSVKWLDRIVIRRGPSTNYYMTSDYKVLPPEVTSDDKAEWMPKIEPLRQYSHQAVFTEPSESSEIIAEDRNRVTVRGYAIRATRVEVVVIPSERGQHKSDAQDAAEAIPSSEWTDATITVDESKGAEDSWSLWRALVDTRGLQTVDFVCRAYDEHGHLQPKRTAFNLRGVDTSDWSVVQKVSIIR